MAGMAYDIETIERIVREIVEQVVTRGVTGFGGGASTGRDAVAEVVQTASPATAKNSGRDVATLLKNVVTLRDVEHLPSRVRRVRVLRTALVTPAVRDELDVRKVRLERVSPAEIEASAGTEARDARVLGEVDVYPIFQPFRAESLLPMGGSAGFQPRIHEGFRCMNKLRQRIVEVLQVRQTLSVVLTTKSDEGLCLLNRDPAVWAVRLETWEDVPEQMRKMETNVVLVDPVRVGVSMARRLVGAAADAFYRTES